MDLNLDQRYEALKAAPAETPHFSQQGQNMDD